jgi:hypothetical protein
MKIPLISQLKDVCIFGVILIAATPACAEQFNFDHTIMRDTVVVQKPESAGTIKKFSDYYKKHNAPRVAIFLNRTLSDDVREWKTEQRSVVAGSGSITNVTESRLRFREETVKGPVATYQQENAGVQVARNNSGEAYLWEFEAGFMQPFLNAGVNLVDRATILRLLSKNSDQGIANEVIETKKNEMNALLTYADIYIELLITRHPSAPTGYEFKAVAKEIKTGRVVGLATSLNWDIEKERPKKVVTTSTGYKVIDDPKMPKVQNISKDMAFDLMNSIIAGWSVI